MPTGTVKDSTEIDCVADYLYQTHMRPSDTEHAVNILFNNQMAAEMPLGTTMKLASYMFDMPMSFIYGEHDWVCRIEEDVADVILTNNRYNCMLL